MTFSLLLSALSLGRLEGNYKTGRLIGLNAAFRLETEFTLRIHGLNGNGSGPLAFQWCLLIILVG